ncbi:MAG TPA: hypothetical protein VK537_06965 [Galbitalea sp.]|nr:hypothetical protein [Galbitalea sp.]
MLGLLPSSELPERARAWLADGADSVNVRALAGGELANDGVRLALLKDIAAEFDLEFPTHQDARRFQAEEIIRSRHFGQNVSFQIYALSNGYTDELLHRLHRVMARLLHR